MLRLLARFLLMAFTIVSVQPSSLADEPDERRFAPAAHEQQLPLRMHAEMERLPWIRVGIDAGDMRGNDNRVLQAAVEYIAAFGGGTVEIGPGEYLMHDSLHLRSHVHIVGSGPDTVLKKTRGSVSRLGIDGDFGEQQITVQDPSGFQVGNGVTVWDERSGGFHTTVARITGQSGNTFSIDKPLGADCLVSQQAQAGTLFPVISGYDLVGASIQNVTIEGNKLENAHLNGCRGAGIFLYRGFGTQIKNCIVRNFNGDGISFQQSNDVQVIECISEGNTELGLHPGSGSQRPTVQGCVARNNGADGLFLCWRVRHGNFEDNLLEGNGRFGISIGHKDTDNLLKKNVVRSNKSHGIFFRNESPGMAAHRNRVIENIIENNGHESGTAAVRVRGSTDDLHFEGNIIRDTRPESQQTQTIGFQFDAEVGKVALHTNSVAAPREIDDQRDPSQKE